MAITDWKKEKTLVRFIVVIQTIAALLCLASLVLPFFKIDPPNANPLLMTQPKTNLTLNPNTSID